MADDVWELEFRIDLRDVQNAEQLINRLAAGVASLDNRNLDGLERGLANTGKNADQAARGLNNLSTTRYALYDVSSTLTGIGVALTGLAVATYAAGIAWERDFAQVIRTSGISTLDNAGSLISTMRENFQDLQSVIPLTSKELAEIGTLAGQLGINAADVTKFTEATAMLAATSDLTADSAATAFGRLNALLPDVQGNFIALGSAILAVGTNSVATESEIARTSTQISAMGAFAGLSAADVIGLSGALASVGVQPELARGTITRTFTLMSRAVSGTTGSLDEFARVAGVSAEEFRSTWGTPQFGDTFLKFMQGLDREGGNAVKVLNDLGITSVRDVPALLRLAQAADSAGVAGGLLAQTMGDARDGIANASELADQFGVIAGTTAAKLQLLVNNVQNFLTSLSQGGIIFGGFLDFLNGLLEGLTEIARNPVGGTILQVVTLLTGLVGVLALAGGGAARAAASMIALAQAMGVQTVAAGGSVLSLRGLQAQLIATGGAAAVLGRSITFLRGGLVGLGAAATAATAFFQFQLAAGAIGGLSMALQGLENDTRSVIDRLAQTGNLRSDNLFGGEGFLSFLEDVQRGLADMGLSTDRTALDVKALDDNLSAMVQGGSLEAVNEILNELAERRGVGVEDILNRMPELRKQLELAATSAGYTGDALDYLGEQTELVIDPMEQLATVMGTSKEMLEALAGAVQDGADSFLNLGDILKSVTEDGKASLRDFNNALEDQLGALANWNDNLLRLVSRGVDEGVIAQLAAMGPEGATLIQQALDDWEGEGQRLVDLLGRAGANSAGEFSQEFLANASLLDAAFSQGGREAANAMWEAIKSDSTHAIADVASKWNIDLQSNPLVPVVDTDPASRALQSLFEQQTGRTIRWNLRFDASNPGAIYGAEGYASGGHIRGPGTGTSDSIPAWLSNGEYVIRAAAVRKYGIGFLDSVNRGAAKFAKGGYASGGHVQGTGAMGGIVELGPRSMSRITRDVVNVINIGQERVANAASQGSRKLQARGSA